MPEEARTGSLLQVHYTCKTLVRMAFREVGIELEFKGEGVDEKAFEIFCSDPKFQAEEGKFFPRSRILDLPKSTF
jgi:GDP-D-mannose dehydratase